MHNKRYAYSLVLLFLVLISILSGCNHNQVEDTKIEKETTNELEVTPSKNEKTMIEEYNQLLQETNDIEKVYQFIETHIDKATPKETDQLIHGLYGYLNDAMEVDYARLEEFYYSLPENVQEFVMLMKTETKIPAIKEGKIMIPLKDLLKRCQALEDHMDNYEDGLTFTFAKNLYMKQMVAAITGGYDTVNKTENIFLEEDGKKIATYAYKEYENFINTHYDTKTKDIVEAYVKVLKKSKKAMNDDVILFYETIYHTIDEEFGW